MDADNAVREGLLVITGEKTREVEDKKDEKPYRMERAWGGAWRIGDINGHCRHSSLACRSQRGLSRPAPPGTGVFSARQSARR
jgi:hypothetical protein